MRHHFKRITNHLINIDIEERVFWIIIYLKQKKIKEELICKNKQTQTFRQTDSSEILAA